MEGHLARQAQAVKQGGDVKAWSPDLVATAGLMTEGLESVARHCVLRAAVEADLEAALRLLARARTVTPWDDTVAACFDEARFRSGKWDALLLADLEKEAKEERDASAAAEYLRVAAHIGKPRDIALASRRAAAVLQGTPHAWMVEVRSAFARPNFLSDPVLLDRLLAESGPALLDPRERLVFALYGEDPPSVVEQARRDLSLQRAALRQAAVQEQERVEEILTRPSRARRPDVPRTSGPDAMERALDALRVRLERPWMAKHPSKAPLEALALRAGRLVGRGEVDLSTWLAALGDELGLVPLLDRAIRGENEWEALVGDALARCTAALDELLGAVWVRDVFEQTAETWPVIQSLGADGADLLREKAAVEQAAADAASPVQREACELALTGLLTRVQARHERVLRDEPADERGDRATVEPDLMTLHLLALERSRDELGTPEWAIARGLAEVRRFNIAGGRRDVKMLRGTRTEDGALFELRQPDSRLPVRVMFTMGKAGRQAVAVLAKQDDEHQKRMIARVQGWLSW